MPVKNTKQAQRVNRKTVPAAVKRELNKKFSRLSDTSGLKKLVWVEDQWAVHPCNQGSKAFDKALYDQFVAELEEDYQGRLLAFQKSLEELNASNTEQPEDNLPEATLQEEINNSPSVTSNVPNLPGSARKNVRRNATIESDENSEVPEVTPQTTFAGTHTYFLHDIKSEVSDEEPSDEEPSDEEPSDEEPSDEEPSNEEPSNEEPDNKEPEKSFTSAETHSGDDSDEPNPSWEKETHDGDSADELSILRKKLADMTEKLAVMTKAFADNATEVLVASQQRNFQQEKDMIIGMYFEKENYERRIYFEKENDKREQFLNAINSAELGDYSILNAVQEEYSEIFN